MLRPAREADHFIKRAPSQAECLIYATTTTVLRLTIQYVRRYDNAQSKIITTVAMDYPN